MIEQIETCSKKGRGMAKASLDLIEAMHAAAKAAQPITGRGIGYKLFTAGLTPSMETKEMQRSTVCSGRPASRTSSRGNGSSMRPVPWRRSQPGMTPSSTHAL